MNPLWTLLFVLSAPRGVLSQVQLRESGPTLVKPSQTLSLTCTVSGFSLSRGGVGWVRQAPGKALECLGGISVNGGAGYNAALKSRLSITKDNSRSQVSLSLSGVTTEDTATYYCVMEGGDRVGGGIDCFANGYGVTNGYYVETWGQGLLVTVSSASIQAPSIYPLRLCCTEEARVRLGCLVKDYLPGSVTVTWDTVPLDGSTLTFPSIQMASSSLYITTSQLTISGEQPKEFTCRVLHAETNSNLNKTISTECAKNFSDPSVKLFYSSCNPNGDTQTTIHLLCRISGYTPGKIKVTWLVDGLKSEELYARSGPEIQEGNLTSTYSEVNITQGQWVSEKTYTCRVNYYGYNFESHAHRCTAESEPRGVSAYLSPPTPLELYVNKSPKITCLVVDLANEKNLSLTWSRANGKPVHAGPPEIKRQFNGTVTVTSTLPVDVTDWVEGETYYCKVSHSDLPTDIQRSISKDVGKRLAPKAYVFLPDGKELENEEELTLTCMIQKFFPRDIFVRWLHNKELMRADQHTTTQPHRADNNTPAFFAYSRLAVPRANWKRGDEFTCQVIHEALPRTRTLEKSVFINSELALEDLCAEEAESEELEETWTSLLVFIVLFLLSMSYGAAVSLCKVKWILAAILQGQPQGSQDYTNVTQRPLPAGV